MEEHFEFGIMLVVWVRFAESSRFKFVFCAVLLPHTVTHVQTSLANVYCDALAYHVCTSLCELEFELVTVSFFVLFAHMMGPTRISLFHCLLHASLLLSFVARDFASSKHEEAAPRFLWKTRDDDPTKWDTRYRAPGAHHTAQDVSKLKTSQATITASPSHLTTPMGSAEVMVTWSVDEEDNDDGSDGDSDGENDWIGIYCPSDTTNNSDYIDWFGTIARAFTVN